MASLGLPPTVGRLDQTLEVGPSHAILTTSRDATSPIPSLSSSSAPHVPFRKRSTVELPLRDRYCKFCLSDKLQHVHLQADPEGNMACPQCHVVDTDATNLGNLVSLSKLGAAVTDRDASMKTQESEWKSFKTAEEKRYKDKVESLLKEMLVGREGTGRKEPTTRIVDYPTLKEAKDGTRRMAFGPAPEHILRGARRWFIEIRRKEALDRQRQAREKGDERQQHEAAREAIRRIVPQVIVSIQLALQESNLLIISNELDRDVDKAVAPGKAKADEHVCMPSLYILYRCSKRHPTSAANAQNMSFDHLLRVNKKARNLLNVHMSDTDAILVELNQAMRRLRTIVDAKSWVERRAILFTDISRKARAWKESEFAFFDKNPVDWTKATRIGYGLYCAQRCVGIWTNRDPQSCATALAIWGLMGAIGQVYIEYYRLTAEVAHEFFMSSGFSAGERGVELKKMLIAWSNSLVAAGIPLPQLNPPSRGGLGNGLNMYSGDLRRQIPEMEMAVVAAEPVAFNWPIIADTRLRIYSDARPLAEELAEARIRYSKNGMRGIKVLPRTVKSDRVKSYTSAEPFPSPAFLERPIVSEFVPPHSPTLDEMLRAPDDSSDGASSHSSDDGEREPSISSFGLGLSDLDRSEPFAFTIGRDGFTRAQPDSSIQISKAPVTNRAPGLSGSASTPTSSLMERQISSSSAATSHGLGAAADPKKAAPKLTARTMPSHYTPSNISVETIGTPLRELGEERDEASYIGILAREFEVYAAPWKAEKRSRAKAGRDKQDGDGVSAKKRKIATELGSLAKITSPGPEEQATTMPTLNDGPKQADNPPTPRAKRRRGRPTRVESKAIAKEREAANAVAEVQELAAPKLSAALLPGAERWAQASLDNIAQLMAFPDNDEKEDDEKDEDEEW